MQPVLNASGYRFVTLREPEHLRESIRSRAHALQLRGTVILAAEGINLALAGAPGAIGQFFDVLGCDTRFAGLEVKLSASDRMPFGRLLVKVKREIIRMNQPVVQPQRQRAPSIDATTLASWLSAGRDDRGREVVMLDARDGFEVDHGHFRNALDWRLRRFSDFPSALEVRRDRLAGKTVVSYCTGGIRCEKAALWMMQEGVANVLQLEGGILRYFELVGAEHFEGSCFVFDRRGTLDSALAPTCAVPVAARHLGRPPAGTAS